MRRSLALPLAVSLMSAPAQSAPPDPAGDQVRFGAFAGAHLNIPIGRGAEKQTARAGLAIAPTQIRFSPNGYARTRTGEGLALEFGRARPQLMLGGRHADVALGLRPATSDAGSQPKMQLSTGAAIGIGVVAVAVVAAVVYLSQDCNRLNENECSE